LTEWELDAQAAKGIQLAKTFPMLLTGTRTCSKCKYVVELEDLKTISYDPSNADRPLEVNEERRRDASAQATVPAQIRAKISVENGNRFYGSGQFREALGCFEKALQFDQSSTAAWRGKAMALQALGRSTDALVCLDHALNLKADDHELWLAKGLLLMSQLGKPQDALECLRQAQHRGSRNADEAVKACLNAMQSASDKGSTSWWRSLVNKFLHWTRKS
jgi:tetratricopeptide (TPR) repeat protein